MDKKNEKVGAIENSDQQISEETKSCIFCEQIKKMKLIELVEQWAVHHIGHYNSEVGDLLLVMMIDYNESVIDERKQLEYPESGLLNLLKIKSL